MTLRPKTHRGTTDLVRVAEKGRIARNSAGGAGLWVPSPKWALALGILALTGLALESQFEFNINTPPPHMDTFYPIKTSIPAPWVHEDTVNAELWVALCDQYTRDGENYYLMQGSDDEGGAFFIMDCYGHVEWPRGQKLGALFLRQSLGKWVWR